VTLTWIHAAVDRTEWPGYVCAGLNLGVSKNAEYFVNNRASNIYKEPT